MSVMDEEMRRFELELAAGPTTSINPFPQQQQQQQQQQQIIRPSNAFLHNAPQLNSIASAPVRFIPHQLMRRPIQPGGMGMMMPPQQIRPVPHQFTPFPPNFAPQMAAPPTYHTQPMLNTFRPQLQSNVLQVSANKAMLDAQKAMAMQTKEPPVMGPQVTPKMIEDTALSNQAKKKTKYVRTAGGEVWEDTSLDEWDPQDFRIFCGDLGNEVNDEGLARAFRKYVSFQRAKVVRDKRTNKSKGYGFVSFRDPADFVRAMKEMNGKYVGNRPIKLRKSAWKDRQLDVAKKRVKDKQKLGLRA